MTKTIKEKETRGSKDCGWQRVAMSRLQFGLSGKGRWMEDEERREGRESCSYVARREVQGEEAHNQDDGPRQGEFGLRPSRLAQCLSWF